MSQTAEGKVMKKGAEHTNQLSRLNRIGGQVRGIIAMIEEKRYCIDILTQLRAVKSALSSLESKIIEEHLNHCVHRAIDSKDRKEADNMIKEIQHLLKKTIK